MRIFSSKLRAGLAGLLIAGIGLTGVAFAAVNWGPSRPTFTWDHPANHITFNSITDNPVWGDERFLIQARDINAGTDTYSTTQKVSDNQEFLVTVYFHNDADSSLNLTATGTRAKIALPSGASTSAEARADISADNSTPASVFSTMDFTSADGQPFSLEYVPGSARLITNYVNTSLSDAVVGSGTAIGTSGADGKVQGCAQFSGYVTIHVKAHVAEQEKPAFSCDMLNLKVDGRKVDANVTFTAKGGATFKNATFDWGDGNKNTVNAASASHTYGADGTFTVNSTLTFDVGGTEKTANCSKKVTISTPTPSKTPTTPVVGKTLPNTGAGSVVSLFAGVSAIAGAAHYLWGRRFGRE